MQSRNTLSNFAVSDTHIFYFVPGKSPKERFSDQDKNDVVDSTLLAQLTATPSANSVKYADDWMIKYKEIAKIAAWGLKPGSDFKTATKDMIYTSIDATATKIMCRKELIVGAAGLHKALLYLKGRSSSGLDILERNGKTGTSGAFQLIVCEKYADSDIIIKMMPFVFETTEPVVSSVFQPIRDARNYTLKYTPNPTIILLNLEEYSRRRASIKEKLTGYVDELVKYLPI